MINSKYWNEELETLPREELEKRQLEDLKEIVQFAYDMRRTTSGPLTKPV